MNKTTAFNLVISGNPIIVSCSANPTTALLGQNITWTGTVSGGTPPFTYSWSGTNIPTSPAPTTNPYTKSYSTIGQKTAALTARDADGLQSTCPVATAQINFNPKFEEF
ncbi:MAG: PKD domain-containing protein [Candidatus Zambryskibacteria bacterium]|nr:PKD domain-containing protein [Candidatus Zambryskibacteria bacterium]